MVQNIGTLVIDAIRPNDTIDTYPTGFGNEIKGGLHSYATYAQMLAIPTSRRTAGMLVSVYNDSNPKINGVFILQNNLTTWKYFNTLQILPATIDNITNGYVYTFLLSAPHVYKVTKLSLQTTTGTAVVSLRINGVSSNINFTTLNVTTTKQTFTSLLSSNYIDVGQTLDILIASQTTNPTLYVELNIERELYAEEEEIVP
jgi:hypothetical protein